jgi:hypothetical protein
LYTVYQIPPFVVYSIPDARSAGIQYTRYHHLWYTVYQHILQRGRNVALHKFQYPLPGIGTAMHVSVLWNYSCNTTLMTRTLR